MAVDSRYRCTNRHVWRYGCKPLITMWNISSRLKQHATHSTAAVVLALGLCSLGSTAQAQSHDPVFGGVVGAGAGAVIGGVAGANAGVQMRPYHPGYPRYYAYPRHEVREVIYVRPAPPPYWQQPRWDRQDDRYRDGRWERDDYRRHNHGHGHRHGHD
jgi:hypothetical protein